MNLPNQLTLSRFVLTGAFFVSLVWEFAPSHKSIALVLFCIAGMTDWIDGALARSRNLITNFGILMDPLADKILVCSAFIAFVGLKMVPSWMAVIIVAREFAITGLRLLAASKQVVLAAEGFGKHKTISQIVAIISVLVLVSHPQWGVVGNLFGFAVFGKPWVAWFAELAMWVTIVLTLLSGGLYLWRNRAIYLDDI